MLQLRLKSKVDGIVHNIRVDYSVYPSIKSTHIYIADDYVQTLRLGKTKREGYDSLSYSPSSKIKSFSLKRFVTFEKAYYALKRIGADEQDLMALLEYMSEEETKAMVAYKFENIGRLVNYRKFFPGEAAKDELLIAKTRCNDFSIVDYEKAHHLDSRVAKSNHVAELMHRFITSNMEEDLRLEEILFLNHQIGFGENK